MNTKRVNMSDPFMMIDAPSLAAKFRSESDIYYHSSSRKIMISLHEVMIVLYYLPP